MCAMLRVELQVKQSLAPKLFRSLARIRDPSPAAHSQGMTKIPTKTEPSTLQEPEHPPAPRRTFVVRATRSSPDSRIWELVVQPADGQKPSRTRVMANTLTDSLELSFELADASVVDGHTEAELAGNVLDFFLHLGGAAPDYPEM